jgi:hypothetical protein
MRQVHTYPRCALHSLFSIFRTPYITVQYTVSQLKKGPNFHLANVWNHKFHSLLQYNIALQIHGISQVNYHIVSQQNSD